MTTTRTFPTRFAAPARLLTAACVFAVAACGGGGGGDKSPTSPGGNTGGNNQTITNVSITGNVTSVNVGQSVQLGALAISSTGAGISTAFTWSSSNPDAATVGASTGTVTGVGVGTASISAMAGGKTGIRVITVSTPGVPGPAPSAVQVDMPGTSFQPSSFSVAIGGTVTWIFTEVAHDVVLSGGTGTPQSIPVLTNTTVQRTFATAGTFTQLCTLHAGMSGTITVR